MMVSGEVQLPRGPVLGWSSFRIIDSAGMPSVENLPFKAFTTSGRAAIYHALAQLQLPPGSSVLVPTYHCPTMVAPVLLAKLKVAYFGLRSDGLPKLDTIDAEIASDCKAMIVSHYFGLARSLDETREWCDAHGIALIEDCAHCYFGDAGTRPIGTWGDYATASLSKFFPMSEGGLLASSIHPIADLQLRPLSLKAQLRGGARVLELATSHNRFAGINKALALVFKAIRAHRRAAPNDEKPSEYSVASMMDGCDMARIDQKPLWDAKLLRVILPRGRIVKERQQNFALYAQLLAGAQGARALFPPDAVHASRVAPYVFPLWVDDPDFVYQTLRQQGLPVFRWDRIWPGTPCLADDVGPLWSHHVLQLLCHQDLRRADIERTSRAILELLARSPVVVGA